MPNLAAQTCTAFSSIALKTGSSSPGDPPMTRNTSLVAACCSNASLSSRRSRATSVSWPEADELLWRTVFGAFALRLRPLDSLLLALERRRIAHPKGLGLRRFSKWHYSRDLRPVEWGSGVSLHGDSQKVQPMRLLSEVGRAARGHPERAQDYRRRAGLDLSTEQDI